MYIVTGGAGFIGSALVAGLNDAGTDKILVVDDLGCSEKWKNLVGKRFDDFEHKSRFLEQLTSGKLSDPVEGIIHMGACSSTTERDANYVISNNYQYTRTLAEWALARNVRFIYASSAAVYGSGSRGFSDADADTPKQQPLNIYGYSKLLFDQWAIRSGASSACAGLRFFNVYGPNEYHKGDMSSVVFKSFHQIRDHGEVKLFKSHNPDYQDGEQCRDFVYVKDCVKVMLDLLQKPTVNGVFNLGSGKARTWKDLVGAVFTALKLEQKIDFIPMPEELRGRYQYFTESDMTSLKAAGIDYQPCSLEEGVADYILNYLVNDWPHW